MSDSQPSRGTQRGRGGRGRRGGDRGDRGSGSGSSRGDSRGGRGPPRPQGGDHEIFLPRNPKDPDPYPNITKFEDNFVNDLSRNLQALSTKDNSTLPLRPAYGSKGTKIVLRTNYFDVTLKEPKVTLWRYEMDIRPKDRGPSGNPRELAKAKQKRYIQLLLNEKMGNVTYATDYAKILVTTTKLSWVKDQGDEFDVVYNDPLERPLPVRTNNEDPKISEARRVRTKQVHVKPNGSFLLSDFLANIVSSGTTGYYASREDVIQFLNIIFNKPAQSDPLVTTVGQKRFFPFSGRTHNLPGHRLMEEWDLSEGLKALRGYYTSVRVGPSRLFVNVNVSTAAFFKEGSLMDLIDEFIGPDRSESGMRKLQVFLKGLKVKTNYLQEKDANGKMQKVTKVRTIFGLAKAPRLGANSKQAMTTWKDAGPNEGKKMSVAEYFFKKHEYTVQKPDRLVVNVGNGQFPSYIPVEVCEVLAGQSARRMLSGKQTSNMIRFAARAPKANAQSIVGNGLALMKVIGPNDQQTAHGKWSIAVGGQMLLVPGRQLQPPGLNFARSAKHKAPIKPYGGSWQLTDMKFAQGATVGPWTCLYITEGYGRAQPQQEIERWMRNAQREAEKYGVRMPACGKFLHVHIQSLKDRAAVDNAIMPPFRGWSQLNPKPALTWVVIPSRDVWLKARIKFFGDAKAGIQTVLSREENLSKGKWDFWANEAAKINLRFGGTCWTIDPQDLRPLDNTYMLMGIDVTHPGPGSCETAPSVAGIVATIDDKFAQYRGEILIQERRQEMVTGLKGPAVNLLTRWRAANGRLPRNILVYRDGVSEGQFGKVLEVELPEMEKAFTELYGKQQDWPNLSITTAGKRHHTRLYPTAAGDSSGKGSNCKPGTIVDRHITGSGRGLYDLYLISQQAIQGTARPAHYTVIRRGINAIDVDAFERITNALCYMWQRSPRSVSYCPPAYYADVLAERGRMYLIRYMVDPGNEQVWTLNNSEWNGQVMPSVKEKMWFV